MKRLIAVLWFVLVLIGMFTAQVFAKEAASADQIPVSVDADIPAVVTEILLDEAYISSAERIPTTTIQTIVDDCREQFQADNTSLVPVSTQEVIKVPFLKSRATVECTPDFVYSTSYHQGVKYEWLHYLDGRVEKTVSYDYDERTSEFKKYTYSIKNENNESLYKGRVEIEEKNIGIHIGDMLFGMAIAVVLMMIGFIVVRAVKKP